MDDGGTLRRAPGRVLYLVISGAPAPEGMPALVAACQAAGWRVVVFSTPTGTGHHLDGDGWAVRHLREVGQLVVHDLGRADQMVALRRKREARQRQSRYSHCHTPTRLLVGWVFSPLGHDRSLGREPRPARYHRVLS